MPSQERNLGFERMLGLMDSKLRVRWGAATGSWVIDRTAWIPLTERQWLERRLEHARRLCTGTPNPDETYITAYKNLVEEVASMRDGRRVVFFATKLNNDTFNAICASDIQAYGGYSRFADELEKEEDAATERINRDLANKRENLHRETFDALNFMLTKRETQLLHGEKDLNTLLHGRKRNRHAYE